MKIILINLNKIQICNVHNKKYTMNKVKIKYQQKKSNKNNYNTVVRIKTS